MTTELPYALRARTVKLYATPGVRPVKVVRVSEPSTVCVAPPGLAVTVQLVGS